MSEWNPQVVKLEKIERHPEADTLQISTVLGGYVVIFKEGRFKEGDLAAYIPVDSVCSDNPEFEWLGTKKRIKAIRLRGIFSLGILATAPEGMVEGDSVVDFYGLKKYVYEEEVADQVNTDNEAAPKGWTLSKYDLEGLRKCSNMFVSEENVVLHEKIEGCNGAVVFDGEKLWVRSRNFFKKEDSLNIWWDVAYRYDLKNKLQSFPMKAIYFELYGQVKGFKYDCSVVNNKIQTKIRVFDIYDVQTMKFLEWENVKSICSEIELETVPEIYNGPWKSDKSLWSLAEGKSLIGEHIKEGFVVRSVPEGYERRFGRKIAKLKSEEYMLKKK